VRIVLRAPRDDDLPQLAEQHGLDRLVEVVAPLDPARDARVAEVGGRLVGSCWVRVVSSVTVFSADGSEAYCSGHVAPEHRRRGVGSALLAWAVQRARATPGVREAFTVVGARDAVPLLASFGFRHAKTAYLMTHPAPAAVPQPTWPEGIRAVTSLRADELVDAVAAACDRAFEDVAGYRGANRSRVARLLAHPTTDPALCLVAMRGGEVVGLNYCRLERHGDAAQGWVEDLGVARPARRVGLGRALLWQGVRELARRGAGSVLLGVDAANAPARRLYEQTGFTRSEEISQHRLVLG